jgi:hypothetical protein
MNRDIETWLSVLLTRLGASVMELHRDSMGLLMVRPSRISRPNLSAENLADFCAFV